MINSERNMTLMQQAPWSPPGEAMAGLGIIAARVALRHGLRGRVQPTARPPKSSTRSAAFWNPKTGYDLRGASHARLRDTPLAMALSAKRHGPTGIPSVTATTG